MNERILGLDIGGANLKAATPDGAAAQWPFALWRQPEQLADELQKLLEAFPHQDIGRFAVTMTGELCDCFRTKRQGVRHILDAVKQVAAGRRIDVWVTDGGFVPIEMAYTLPRLVAASNWQALATYVSRIAENAILVDVGSTTTDVIPIVAGEVAARGRTDEERLPSGELVYTGVRRTPICALLGKRVMAEFFATTQDAYLLLGQLPEDCEDCETPDSRPAMREFAEGRLARMLGGDVETIPADLILGLAIEVELHQRGMLVDAIRQVRERMLIAPTAVIVSGAGEFLAQAAWVDLCVELERTETPELVSFSNQVEPALSRVACAFALAVLAQEQGSL